LLLQRLNLIFDAMLVQTSHIHSCTSEDYDRFLAKGWFRGAGIIYRSEIVCLDEEVYSIRNIRLNVAGFQFRKRQRKLLRINNERFRVTLGPPRITEEKELLYQKHSIRFKAFVHTTLSEIVFSNFAHLIFNTREICVYDGDKIIAVSYFDIGHNSMASIIALFDEEYSACSLGYFTMLVEMLEAQQYGLSFYYPGYVMDRPSVFDYKLRLGDYHWLSASGKWVSNSKELEPSKASKLRDSLAELHVRLSMRGIQCELTYYPYFTAGYLMQRQDPDLLYHPVYLCFKSSGYINMATYDIEEDCYVYGKILPSDSLDGMLSLEVSEDYRSSKYQMQVQRFIHKQYTTDSAMVVDALFDPYLFDDSFFEHTPLDTTL
jgi:leucyl-tRNA---protein transferase